MKKKIAIALYVAYFIALVLVITFGTPVSSEIISGMQQWARRKEIEDVVISLNTNEVLSANSRYEFDFTPKGRFGDDAGLVFESLDTDVIGVDEEGGTVYTHTDFDGAEAEGRVRVTSKHDADFEKIFTFRVKKIYPDTPKLEIIVPGCGYNLGTLRVGMEVYPYCYTEEKGVFNDYSIVCDEEYFTYDAERSAYIAVKATEGDERISFSAVYPNGKTVRSEEFSISDASLSDSFDEIRISDEPCDSIALTRGESIMPVLYKDDERISANVEISLSDPSAAALSNGAVCTFKSAGDYTLTFALPNGYSKTLSVTVRNVMGIPSILGGDDADRITVTDEKDVEIGLSYPTGVTYTSAEYVCDSDIVELTPGENGFTVTPKSVGVATVKITLDDGYGRLEGTYVIEVVKHVEVQTRTDRMIVNFVSKVLGHMLLFAGFAAVTVNLFRYAVIKNTVLRSSLYFASALPAAVLTELIQMIQPGRYPRFKDVLIDMLGFLIGTGITVLVIYLRKRSKNKKAGEAEALPDGTEQTPKDADCAEGV